MLPIQEREEETEEMRETMKRVEMGRETFS